jgi:ElaB/YqjD/DUF883 family membrane-anchored ribosome-binding protein
MDDDKTRTTGNESAEEREEAGRFGKAKEFVGSKYNRVRERAEDLDFGAMADGVRDYVRTNPGKALLISVGVGFVVGLLLRSEDDD